MALSIKTAQADALARAAAALTGETMPEGLTVAVRERLEKERARRNAEGDYVARAREAAARLRVHSDTRPVTKPNGTRRRETPDVIVADSSAVAAILFGEEMAGPLVERLVVARERLMSVVNYVEVGTVLAGRRHTQRERALAELDAFLEETGISLAAVDARRRRRRRCCSWGTVSGRRMCGWRWGAGSDGFGRPAGPRRRAAAGEPQVIVALSTPTLITVRKRVAVTV